MFIEPQPTAYDLRFNLFGFPVRVHPAFFLMPLILGSSIIRMSSNAGVGLLVLEIIFFLSILVHELGHAVAIRHFGNNCHIVLYWLGGLAITGDEFSSWRGGRSRSVTPRAQIIISLAGPVFGFLLAGVFAIAVIGLGGQIVVIKDGLIPLLVPDFSGTTFSDNEAIRLFFFVGLWSTIFWNALNLVPVFPLDGGQIARQIFIINDPWDGVRKATILSFVAALVIAVLGLSQGDRFMGIMFGFLAFESYQSLNQFGSGRGRPW